MTQKMKLKVNGEQREFESLSTLDELIAAMQLADRRIAVEHNQQIIPRGRFAEVALNDQDEIEIIHAIGGG